MHNFDNLTSTTPTLVSLTLKKSWRRDLIGFDVTDVSEQTGLGAVGLEAAVDRRLDGLTVKFNGERDRSRVYHT